MEPLSTLLPSVEISLDDNNSSIEVEINSLSTQLQLFQTSDIIRPDFNIGKWAGLLFSSPYSKDLTVSKKMSWSYDIHGETVKASLLIRPIQGRKRLTTTTYRIFLALLQIWEHQDRPADGVVNFSARQLTHTLGRKWCGKSTAMQLQEHIDILTNTSITWTYAFRRDGEMTEKLSNMSLLDSHDYLERSEMRQSKRFTRFQKVRLNTELVTNMLNGETKPVNYSAFISIDGDSSANLYLLLDNYLAKKNHWSRRAMGLLLDELGFEPKRYQSRRTRLAKLKQFVLSLDGKELSSGTLSLKIAPTVDQLDYKLVASKTPFAAKPKSRHPQKSANAIDDIPQIVELIITGLEQISPGRSHINRDTLKLLAHWYPKSFLLDQLAILKADYRTAIKKSAIKAYVYLLHVEAHRRGWDWIKPCPSSCSHRPQNRQALPF